MTPHLHQGLRAGLLCLGLVAGRPACADDGRAQVEQRIRLAAQLLADSPAAQRIISSGHTQAVGHIQEGRLHHAMAEDALNRGDLAAARRAVDESLRHMGAARRLVPNTTAQQTVAQRRYELLLASLERLMDGWRTQTLLVDAADGDLLAATGLVTTARAQGEAGRHIEAVFTLELAEQHVLSGMKRTLQRREVDYTLRASTPAEAYQHELQRQQAMADLLPLALSELKPKPEAVSLIERYAETGRQLRGQAQQLFASGDVQSALDRVRSSILFLQRGLQAAGVSMPQPVEGSP